jgi:hypothetical protein
MELRLDLEPSTTLNLRTISMGRVIWDQGETDPQRQTSGDSVSLYIGGVGSSRPSIIILSLTKASLGFL